MPEWCERQGETPGDQLRRCRKKQKLTAQQVAERLGVRRMTVVAWERGTHTPTRRYHEGLRTLLGWSP